MLLIGLTILLITTIGCRVGSWLTGESSSYARVTRVWDSRRPPLALTLPRALGMMPGGARPGPGLGWPGWPEECRLEGKSGPWVWRPPDCAL